MKKLLTLLITFIFMLSLSACGLFGDDEPDPEDIAKNIIDNWDGDLSHLSAAQTAMNVEDSFEMVFSMNLEGDDNGHDILYTITYTMRAARINGVKVTELLIEINSEAIDMMGFPMNQNPSIHYIIEEFDTHMNFYFNTDVFDAIDDEDYLDEILAVFGLNQSWIRFTLEDDMQNLVEREMLENLLSDYEFDAFLENYFDTSDIDSIYDDLETLYNDTNNMVMNYLDFDYLNQYEFLEIDVEQTEENYILTTLQMQGDILAEMFEDMIIDLVTQMSEVDALYPSPDEITNDPEFQMYKDTIADATPARMEVTYDPVNYEYMAVSINATETFNDFIEEMGGNERPVTDFSITIEIKDNAIIEVPTEFGDVNHAIQEAAKLIIMQEVYHVLRDAAIWHGPGTYTLEQLNTYAIKIFDMSLSTVTVADQTAVGTFYYIDGTQVLTEAVDYQVLDAMIDDFSEVPNREDMLALIDYVDDDNFSLTYFAAAAIIEELEAVARERARETLEAQAYEIIDAAHLFCSTQTGTNYENYCAYDGWYGAKEVLTYAALSSYLSADFANLDFGIWMNESGYFEIIVVTNDHYIRGNETSVRAYSNHGHTYQVLYDWQGWAYRRLPE